MRRLQPRAERLLRACAVDAHHVRVGHERGRPVAWHELAQPVEPAPLPGDARSRERRRIGVVGHRVGDLAVERPPCLVEALKLLLVTCERAVGPERTAPGEIDVDLAEDDEVVGDPPACLLARHGPAPQRDHGGVGGGQRHPHGVLLDPPELLLAALGEELRDRLPGTFLDRGVEIEKGPLQAFRELPAERRLARAHEADEDDVAAERVQRHPTRSTYARHAATKSPTASPPNFSCAARASSQATADSATTASASTAATSDRSTSA